MDTKGKSLGTQHNTHIIRITRIKLLIKQTNTYFVHKIKYDLKKLSVEIERQVGKTGRFDKTFF